MKPVHQTPVGVKTAWADPEHMRLVRGSVEDRVNPTRLERLHGPDPDDPWAAPLPDEDTGSAA